MSKENILRHARQIEISLGELESQADTLDHLTDQELSDVQRIVKRLDKNAMNEAISGEWARRNVAFGGWLRRVHQLTEDQIQQLEQDAEAYRRWRQVFDTERLAK